MMLVDARTSLASHVVQFFVPNFQGLSTPISQFSLHSHSQSLIGKLTAFLQLQEFSLRNMIVVSSTSAARLSLHSSKAGLVWLSLRRQLYVST
jgi:hypothetical protein